VFKFDIENKTKKVFFQIVIILTEGLPSPYVSCHKEVMGLNETSKKFRIQLFLKEIWIDEKKITYGYVYLVKSTYTSVVCLCHNCNILKWVYPISQRVFLNVW